MTTDLALPEISAPGLVPNHDLSLVRQLRSSWNVRLRTKWTREAGRQSLSSLEIEAPGVKAAGFAEALAHLNEANNAHAHPTQIAKGLAVLTAVCAKPADFDDAKVVLWSERLKQVLSEYPGDIALAAISGWPKTNNGKWWPTENELRTECDLAMGFRRYLKHELEEAQRRAGVLETPHEPEPSDGLDYFAVGATRDFYNEFAGIVGGQRADRMFTNARYDHQRIGVRDDLLDHTVERLAPGLLKKWGVRIVRPRGFDSGGRPVWPE